MANPFDVEVYSPLQSLLAGEQGYTAARKRSQETQTNSALRTLLSGGQPGADGTGGVDWQGAARALAANNNLDGAVKVGTLAKTFQPESSADIQAFKMAQTQGYRGGILDFMKEKAAAGATRVNQNVNTGEREYDKQLAGDMAKQFIAYQKAGRDAAGALNTLQYMENLTNDPNFYSGTGGELVARGRTALASMGVTAPESAGPSEVFGALSNKLTLDASGGSLGAQISNSDRDFLQNINPNLSKTAEGNRQLIAVQRKVYQRQQEVARMAREYAQKNRGRLDAGFEEQVARYADANPLFPKASRPTPAPAPAQRTAPAVQGAKQAPDGKFYVPDPQRPGKFLEVQQ